MKRHLVASPSLGRDEGADTCNTPPKKSLLALAGAGILLLGCQQDPVGKAPGGLEPSASSQQSGDRDDNGAGDPGDGVSGGSGAQNGNSGGAPGRGDSDSDDSGDSGSGSGSGDAN